MSNERRPPYLRLQTVTVPVADLDRSLSFYEITLGFKIIQRMSLPEGVQVGLVAPPDGDAILILSESDPDHRLGTPTGVTFLTDNLDERCREWSARGVHFAESPWAPFSGARGTIFLDIDRNIFQLVEADVASQQLEHARRTAAERAERERRAAHELTIAIRVQAGLLPRERPFVRTLDYAAICL